MATIQSLPIKVDLIEIEITEWLDTSSPDGRSAIPTTMRVTAVIGGLPVDNISLPYIPVSNFNEIREAIIKTLMIDAKYTKK